jgi:anti-sigma regulatory factor (Ser/Thr protein kinase)
MGAVPAAMIPDQEAARWPYQSHLELGAISSAVPSARLHARLVLWEWGLSADKAEAAELIVSELVTNALEHGSAGIPATVRIWLSSDGGSIAINVWDASPQPPVPKNAGADADSGRGLMIVAALSTDWGYSAADPGKVVWAVIDAKEGAGSER